MRQFVVAPDSTARSFLALCRSMPQNGVGIEVAVGNLKLSRRGQQIAELIAQGLSNREIGNRLFLSERTIEWHVEQIFNKLGVNSRSQVAVWTVQNSLVALGQSSVGGNLPARTSTFVGRQSELRSLTELSAKFRELTLIGPGGVGKTRLALQLATAIQSRFPEGAWVVDLAPVSHPELVPSVIRSELGVQENQGRTATQLLVEHCQRGPILIVLDNCEHVIDASSEVVARLVSRCPRLTIVATSRESLRIDGETVFRVDPLAHQEAIDLFLDRASAAQSKFVLPGGAEAGVADICESLDRLPLAIELAAARIGALPMAEMRTRLASHISLLDRGRRAQPRHHESLRAAINWSYELLTNQQRQLFDRLAVFHGFDLEAAASVCCVAMEEPNSCTGLLMELVDKSLVHFDLRRYRLLETLRAFGLEKLSLTDEEAQLRERHCRHYLALAEDRPGGGLARWLQGMETDRDNLRSALAWALDNEIELAARLVLALDLWWRMHARLDEAHPYLERLLQVRENRDATRVRLLTLAGRYRHTARDRIGTQDLAADLEDSAIALGRQVDDQQALIDALLVRGRHALDAGDLHHSRVLLQEAHASAEVIADREREAEALHLLGCVDGAQLEFGPARVALERSLEIRRELDRNDETASTLQFLAGITGAAGDLPRARQLIAQALMLGRDLGEGNDMHYALDITAAIAILEGDAESGITLVGAVDAALERISWLPIPVWDGILGSYFETGRQALGSTRAPEIEQAGREMSYGEAIEFALDWLASRSELSRSS